MIMIVIFVYNPMCHSIKTCLIWPQEFTFFPSFDIHPCWLTVLFISAHGQPLPVQGIWGIARTAFVGRTTWERNGNRAGPYKKRFVIIERFNFQSASVSRTHCLHLTCPNDDDLLLKFLWFASSINRYGKFTYKYVRRSLRRLDVARLHWNIWSGLICGRPSSELPPSSFENEGLRCVV